MCTGFEVAAIIGAGAAAASTMMADPKTPQMPQTPEPLKDMENASASAAAAGISDRIKRRRALRAQSLLATGGPGDTSNPVTGAPSATAGKATLGA